MALELLVLILLWMWQRAFVVKHLTQITTINPAVAHPAPDEMHGLVV